MKRCAYCNGELPPRYPKFCSLLCADLYALRLMREKRGGVWG